VTDQAPLVPPTFPWVLGLDLGQAADFTALTMIDPTGDPAAPVYDARHVERIALNTSYPAIVAYVGGVVAHLRGAHPRRPVQVAIDFTGVGRPVADLFVAAQPDATLTLVTITGADSVTRGERGDWRVPKRDLASVVQIMLQSSRLRFPAGLPIAETLKGELVGFRAKTKLNGHQTFEAGDDWRAGTHDDLVLSLAVGLWAAERFAPPPSVPPVAIFHQSRWVRPGQSSPLPGFGGRDRFR
jgi:hypothetical protein